jgi:hypothetical protein
MVYGDPKVGKTVVVENIIAAVITGRRVFNKFRPSGILVWSTTPRNKRIMSMFDEKDGFIDLYEPGPLLIGRRGRGKNTDYEPKLDFGK